MVGLVIWIFETKNNENFLTIKEKLIRVFFKILLLQNINRFTSVSLLRPATPTVYILHNYSTLSKPGHGHGYNHRPYLDVINYTCTHLCVSMCIIECNFYHVNFIKLSHNQFIKLYEYHKALFTISLYPFPSLTLWSH